MVLPVDVEAHSLGTRHANHLAKPEPQTQIQNPPIPLAPLQRARVFKVTQHARVVHVVHGTRDAARVDGHVRPAEEEGDDGN